MKKQNLLMVFVLALISIGITSPVFAQNKTLKKQLKKEYKKKIKEYKKGGWKIDGTSRTIEVKLLQHYEQLNNGGNKELVGSVSTCDSKNVCRQNALNNALTYYASQAGSYVKGKVISDLFNNQSSKVPEEFDKMYAAYERLVGKEIKGEVIESYSIIKENGESNSYDIYYLVDEVAASQARIRAFEQAAKESKIAQEYAESVSEFINESFDLKREE